MSKNDVDLDKAKAQMEQATQRFKEQYEDLQKRIAAQIFLPNAKPAQKPREKVAAVQAEPVQKLNESTSFLQKLGAIKSPEQ